MPGETQQFVFSLVLCSFLYFIVHMCECHMYQTLTYLLTYLLTYAYM